MDKAAGLEIKDNGGSYYRRQYVAEPVHLYKDVVKLDIYKKLLELFKSPPTTKDQAIKDTYEAIGPWKFDENLR